MPDVSITLQKDAINVKIEVTVQENNAALDISAATTHNFIVRKPSGTKVTWTGTFSTNGVNGGLFYKTIAGDLNEVGTYKLQVNLLIPGTYTGLTSQVAFYVGANL